jgi:hypothetical protein
LENPLSKSGRGSDSDYEEKEKIGMQISNANCNFQMTQSKALERKSIKPFFTDISTKKSLIAATITITTTKACLATC